MQRAPLVDDFLLGMKSALTAIALGLMLSVSYYTTIPNPVETTLPKSVRIEANFHPHPTSISQDILDDDPGAYAEAK